MSPPHLINQPLQTQPLWHGSGGGIGNNSNQNNHNSIIENLSTLRASDINERERNLLEKIRLLKQENKGLVQLLKDNETVISDKIGRQKKETD